MSRCEVILRDHWASYLAWSQSPLGAVAIVHGLVAMADTIFAPGHLLLLQASEHALVAVMPGQLPASAALAAGLRAAADEAADRETTLVNRHVSEVRAVAAAERAVVRAVESTERAAHRAHLDFRVSAEALLDRERRAHAVTAAELQTCCSKLREARFFNARLQVRVSRISPPKMSPDVICNAFDVKFQD